LPNAQIACFCSTAAPRIIKNPGLHGNVVAAMAPPKANPEIPEIKEFELAVKIGTFSFGILKGNNPSTPMPNKSAMTPAIIFQYPPDTLIVVNPKETIIIPIIRRDTMEPTINNTDDLRASLRFCLREIEYPAIAPIIGNVQHEHATALRIPNTKEKAMDAGPYPAPSINDLVEAINPIMVYSFQSGLFSSFCTGT
jgi:hypothetical protein